MTETEDFIVITDAKQNVFQAKVRKFLKEGHKIVGRAASTKQEKFVAFFFYIRKEQENK